MKKKLLSVLGLILIFSIMLSYVANLVKWKHSGNEYRIFYEKSSDFDVLFFGASVVHYSIYPMQLWNDYGITSYNMANDSERLQMTYYDILNALDYASPQLIVVDLAGVGWAGSMRDESLKDHAFLDSVPLSKNKLTEINALFDGAERLEYIFPFELYHSRWEELEKGDFEFNTRLVEYGAQRHPGIMPFEAPSPDKYEESRESDVELERDTIANIIDLCNSRGIKVIFTYLPAAIRGGDQKNREQCAQIMQEFDVDYYDMLYVDCIDWGCDSIEGAHLNYYGGRKLTNYVGELLTSTYDLTDHRDDSTINEGWNNDYLAYEQEVEIFVSESGEEYIQAGGKL